MQNLIKWLKEHKAIMFAGLFCFFCMFIVILVVSCHTFDGNSNNYDNTHVYTYTRNCLLINGEPCVEMKAIFGIDDIAAALIIGSVASIATAGVSAAASSKQNKQIAEENDITRQREDNAIQRRVKDLEAAGLSPVLAAGSGASTSSPISPVKTDVSGLQGLLNSSQLMSAIKMNSDIATAAGTRAVMEAQEENIKADTRVKDAQSGKLAFEVQGLKFDNQLKEAYAKHDYPQIRELESKIDLNKKMLDIYQTDYVSGILRNKGIGLQNQLLEKQVQDYTSTKWWNRTANWLSLVFNGYKDFKLADFYGRH